MQEERFGTRDRTYSAWHRAASVQRFIGWERAQLLHLVDADCVLFLEIDPGTKEALALIEAAVDVGQDHKPATAITRLAKRARIPAYLVLYRWSEHPNPADPRARDITGFRVKRLWPRAEKDWRQLEPQQWAEALLQIRAWAARRLDIEAANDPQWGPRPGREAGCPQSTKGASC